MFASTIRNSFLSPPHHRWAALDGLRGVAILLVLLVHVMAEMRDQLHSDLVERIAAIFDPIIAMGGTGVHLFFVLSGFLLFYPFAMAARDGYPGPSWGAFYARRVLRIVPAYWVALLLTGLIIDPRYRSLRYTDNYLLHGLLIHNLLDRTDHSIIGPAWTLAIEFQFYLLLPVLAAIIAAAARRYGRAGPAAILAAMILIGVGAQVAAAAIHRISPAAYSYRHVLGVAQFAPLFAAGMMVALAVTLRGRRAGPTRSGRLVTVIGVVGLAVFGGRMLVQAAHIHLPAAVDYYTFTWQMAICYGAILCAVVFGGAAWRFGLTSRPIRFIGNISYSLYLLHYPILQFWILPVAARATSTLLQVTLVAAGVVVILVPAAALSYLFIERPFIALSPRDSPRPGGIARRQASALAAPSGGPSS